MLDRRDSYILHKEAHRHMSARSKKDLEGLTLDIQEVRLISDLRIMYSKVDELHNIVEA